MSGRKRAPRSKARHQADRMTSPTHAVVTDGLMPCVVRLPDGLDLVAFERIIAHLGDEVIMYAKWPRLVNPKHVQSFRAYVRDSAADDLEVTRDLLALVAQLHGPHGVQHAQETAGAPERP